MQTYIEVASNLNQNFYITPLYKQILQLSTSFNCIFKAIKLFYSIPKMSKHLFASYHPHYRKKLKIILIKFAYDLFFLRLPSRLLSLFSALSNCIVKFATYHPYYKDKLVGNSSRIFVCITNYLCLLYSWRNLSIAFIFVHNSSACLDLLDLVTKKKNR